MQQTTNTILMIRPINFRMNEETASTNFYQQETKHVLPATINQKAQEEFDDLVAKLRKVGVKVLVVDDTKNTNTPDALFPNNWVSFHQNGDVAMYPMFAKNRRLERREDVLDMLESEGFQINNIIDYTEAEIEKFYLEGTGSLVLDRVNRKAYCAISPRTDEELCIEFCEDFEFTPVLFKANQTVAGKREAIYHTNVMMSVATNFAIVSLQSIDDKKERKSLLKQLKLDNKEIIAITEKQVDHFAGNMLEVRGENDKLFLIMSTSAYNSLTSEQLRKLQKHTTIIHSKLETIELSGGGSARCMMAEIFLPKTV